jgi:hypothetical protein
VQIASAAAAASTAATKEGRKAAVKVLQKALLKAEQLKATEALRACLPMVAAASAAEASAFLMPAADFRVITEDTAQKNQEGISALPADYASEQGPASFTSGPLQTRQRVSSAAMGVRGMETLRNQAKALEYAKQRGIYRGDDLSW